VCIDKRESWNEAARASQQDRSASRETQPFIFQAAIARGRSVAPRNNHNPKVLSQIMLVPADNLPQTAADAIASDCASEAARSNKADARKAGVLDSHSAKHQQFAAHHQAVSFYALIFWCLRQAASF
jgi:hypothetical protein